jgi:hypothetical protein
MFLEKTINHLLVWQIRVIRDIMTIILNIVSYFSTNFFYKLGQTIQTFDFKKYILLILQIRGTNL